MLIHAGGAVCPLCCCDFMVPLCCRILLLGGCLDQEGNNFFFFFFSRKLITNSIMCLVLEVKMSCNISVLKSTSAKLSSSVCTGGNTNQTHTRASLQTRVQEHPMANSLGNIFSGSNKQVHFTHRLAGIGSLK